MATDTATAHTRSWHVRLDLFEEGDTTVAHIVLDTGDNVLETRAEAHRSPGDPQVPEIGDEFAAGRALVQLGHRLIHSGETDSAPDGRDA